MPTEPNLTALGGSVPLAPVFVSAEQVRIARDRKQSADERASAVALSISDAPSAEALARRWLGGLSH